VSIDLERRGPVALITLNRPSALNAMSVEMLDDLAARLGEVDGDPSVRAVVLTGAGEKAFCAGADVGHMRTASALEARAFSERGHRVANLLENMATPVVAAINGFALGGGCEMALACDIRVAADTARFGQPEVTLGIIPGWGGTQRLARATNIGFAKDLVITGRLVKADEALRVGLVTHVHPPTSSWTRLWRSPRRSRRDPRGPPARQSGCATSPSATRARPLAREIDTFALAFTTDDQREGMEAFLDKRPARFADMSRRSNDGR